MFRTMPVGIVGRSTVHSDTPRATRFRSYADTSGVETKEPQIVVRLFNDRGAACLKGGVYMVGYSATLAKNPIIETCAAVTVDRYVVVALEATADQAWGDFVIEGYCNALVDGDATDVVVGDTLKIVAATNADAFIQDQSGPTRTADSVGIACEANASTEALKKVMLYGDKCDID